MRRAKNGEISVGLGAHRIVFISYSDNSFAISRETVDLRVLVLNCSP